MAEELDPLSQAFKAIWQLAESHRELSQLVRIGNRINLSDDFNRSPFKETVQAADMPELLLLGEGATRITLYNASCASMMIRQYIWQFSTGDVRVNHLLHPVEWALTCAMSRWGEVLSALTWRGYHFVKRCDWLDSLQGQDNTALNRNLEGWTALMRLEVEMHFPTKDLRDDSSIG